MTPEQPEIKNPEERKEKVVAEKKESDAESLELADEEINDLKQLTNKLILLPDQRENFIITKDSKKSVENLYNMIEKDFLQLLPAFGFERNEKLESKAREGNLQAKTRSAFLCAGSKSILFSANFSSKLRMDLS